MSTIERTQLINRELSWLSFNARVLQEANDKSVPLIEREIKHKKQGKESWIFWKMNNLVDEQIIRLLYQASGAGVKIRLIIRGICSLIPGVKGLSENIEAISIVDKYLEHARVMVFCNDGKPDFFIASSDMMTRNLDFRSEVAVPVYDKNIQQELMDILEIQWRDNVKAQVLNAEQNNMYRKTGDKEPHRAQEEIYRYLKEKLVLQPAAQLS
jgi:polyphosphate kinase